MTQQRRKILLFDNGKEWGGGTNSMLELLKRVDRQRFDITCCFYVNYLRGEGESIEQVLNSMGIPVIFQLQTKQPRWAKISKEIARTFLFFSHSGRKNITAFIDNLWRIEPNAQRLRKQIITGEYDLLYMNNQPATNIEGYLAAKGLPISVVQHCRIEPIMTAKITETVNQIASKVIAVSRGVESALINYGVKPSLCATVFNAIDIHQPLPDRRSIRSTLNIDNHCFIFGSIGSLILRKSCHHTLEALARFNSQHPEAKWKMILVGVGPERTRLLQLAEKHGFANRLVFTGFRNNPLDYLAAFDAFILASKSEGLPRVILEAMLLKTVVIGSQVTGTAELIESGKTGLLFPYGDTKMLASHLQKVWQDDALRARLTEQAYSRVVEQYAIEHYIAGVEDILEAAKPTGHCHV